jgi:hypothetical protein
MRGKSEGMKGYLAFAAGGRVKTAAPHHLSRKRQIFATAERSLRQ